MQEKFDLNKMLEEIKEDAQEEKKSASRMISQEDIKKMILEKSKKRKEKQ
jgi:hypothetical protein